MIFKTFWREGWAKLLVKPNSTVKTRNVYRVCDVCYQAFLENEKIDFKSKIWNFSLSFQA